MSLKGVQYVRITNKPNEFLNIAEIEVYDMNNNNIALNKTVTMSSIFPSFEGKLLVDGNRTNFAHTNNGPSEFMEINLGSEFVIKSIKIYNRVDCCKERLNGAKLEIRDSKNNKHEFPQISTTQDIYEFNDINKILKPQDEIPEAESGSKSNTMFYGIIGSVSSFIISLVSSLIIFILVIVFFVFYGNNTVNVRKIIPSK
jgi:hypothetical protein